MENNPVEGPKAGIVFSLRVWEAKLLTILGTILTGMIIAGFFTKEPFHSGTSAIGMGPLCWPVAALIFPSGLYNSLNTPSIFWLGLLLCAWLLYAVITFVGTRTKKWKSFFVIYGILVIILVLNIRGCAQHGAS